MPSFVRPALRHIEKMTCAFPGTWYKKSVDKGLPVSLHIPSKIPLLVARCRSWPEANNGAFPCRALARNDVYFDLSEELDNTAEQKGTSRLMEWVGHLCACLTLLVWRPENAVLLCTWCRGYDTSTRRGGRECTGTLAHGRMMK